MEPYQKACPHCGETIKAKADLCRYCQGDVSGVPAGWEGGLGSALAAPPIDLTRQWYCDHCGYVGHQKNYTKGSLAVALLLYLLMILPGILYTLWCLTSNYKGCPKCGTPNMMPATSPKARAAFEQQRIKS